ncbi:hypothetical protein KGP17_22795 [Serratia sp. JSRIV001]|uniref:hypothetical protein n=1 Tax=unclassified Serratia (in: enterobacteria) TaxID=2647522 RepID=UPI001CBB3FB6|nr:MULTISPECIES: hypothetical protein [unclassified Serratia (in: enterobacteria)]UAN45197.1 hypothetical protein KGP17_22795 [Serratia sp. JSRIV001]UAN54530.1 hypothetical protein KGP26_28445 [Serratia sp. JSRIV002]UAN60541.1 hypothetical protein KGP21_28780 [Serratia sp. JSRIV004]
MKDKITVLTREQLKGNDNILNPIAELRNEPQVIMNIMHEISDSKLSGDKYLRAKEIIIDVCQKNEKPTLLMLVNAWKADPMLEDFAESIAVNALPRAHGHLFDD